MEVVAKEDMNEENFEDVMVDGSSSPDLEVITYSAISKIAASVQGRTTGPTRRSTKGGWTEKEDDMLKRSVRLFNGKHWKKIAQSFPGRSDVQCLHRWQKVLNPDLVKGPWTKEEDECIIELVEEHGSKKWSVIAQSLPGRIGKQCRERWHNHLNPTIKKDAWTKEEELALIRAHQTYGNKWAEIAKHLPGRADNSIKNHWNCSVKKKLDSYLASGGDLLGINAYDFYNHDCKEESVKVKVSYYGPETECFLDRREEDSDDGIDTSLGLLVSSGRHKKGLQSNSEPVQVRSMCLEEEMQCQKESPTMIQFECRSPTARGPCSAPHEEANCARRSDGLHHPVTEMEMSRRVSSGTSMMTVHPLGSIETANLSSNSPRLPGQSSLPLATLSDPVDVKCGKKKCQSPRLPIPIPKRIPESPKRPRHHESPLHGCGGMNSRLNNRCHALFSKSPDVFGREYSQATRKSEDYTTTSPSKDSSFGFFFNEPVKQTNPNVFVKNGRISRTEKEMQQTDSPVYCSTPPSRIGYVNGSSPETILRTAAKNFKNTPSIIRKRTRGTSNQVCNANYSNIVCMSEVGSVSSDDSLGSTNSCDHVHAGQDDVTLLNVNWLSLSSPSLEAETDVPLKSVEKRLEYAFDLEWDNSKGNCSMSATESDSTDGNLGTVHNSPDFSGVRSNQTTMLLGFGVNPNSELN